MLSFFQSCLFQRRANALPISRTVAGDAGSGPPGWLRRPRGVSIRPPCDDRKRAAAHRQSVLSRLSRLEETQLTRLVQNDCFHTMLTLTLGHITCIDIAPQV